MTQDLPVHALPVLLSGDVRVSEGVNRGDALSLIEDLVPDDIYECAADATPHRLALHVHGESGLTLAEGSALGRPGNHIHLDGALSLMSEDGTTLDTILLVEVDADTNVAAIYLLPITPMTPGTGYRLVGTNRTRARALFAQMACVSFTRGTHITMADGRQIPIEALSVGDRVLTRDDGPREIRWIGQTTLRAAGAFAPIVITRGTLNNENDLVVSPDHRLFVYQRADMVGAGKAELLVKARHLVNGTTVYTREGGHVEYFQLLFDRHHLIYAEGIAAESMLVEPRTRPALPPELLEKLSDVLPRHDGGRDRHGLDLQRALLDRPDAIELLRRASSG